MKKVWKAFGGVILALLVIVPSIASAHVGYVLDQEQFAENQGSDTAFLFGGLREAPQSVVVVAVVSIILIGLILFFRSRPGIKIFLARCREKLSTYGDILEWMARLSLGIALIGAGTAEAFISPVLTGNPNVGLLEILLGFMMLLGFLLTPVYLATIVLFFVGIAHSGYLIGNLDFLALTIAAFSLSTARPGLDDILGIGAWNMGGRIKHLVPLVLRIGLGTAFIFLAVYEKFLNPHGSEAVVQIYNLTQVIPVPASLWVLGAGIVELVLGVLLIIGFEIRLVSIISFVVISLSFFYFKESVYSHVTLFGALSMLVVTGAGKWSVDNYFSSNKENLS
ncbi:MAG: DoxX family protein [Candidatus Pacebacteria bacterium]|nr:DoxX family protein [Candidatus Paceibacterota bacterium]